MKKHISLFGLFARSSLWKILGTILLMATVEVFFFHRELQQALETFEATGYGMANLEQLFARSATNVYFALGFLLVSIALCLPGCEFKSHPGYTLRRLSVSENTVFFHQALYSTLAYGILAAVQLAVAFGLCRYYISAVPAQFVSQQTVFLAFYRSDFLHALLPLEDIALWIRNGLLALCLGLSAATFPFKQRRGKYTGSILALAIYTIVYFDRQIGDIFHVITAALIAAAVAVDVFWTLRKEKVQEVTQDA